MKESCFDSQIEERLKHIFDCFAYIEKVPQVDTRSIFTPAEYMKTLSLIYRAISSHTSNNKIYSLLTEYIQEFNKKVIKNYIENEISEEPYQCLIGYTEVISHYEKLALFIEKFFVYGDKKEFLILNFRELTSKRLFYKYFIDQILPHIQVRACASITSIMNENGLLKMERACQVKQFLTCVLVLIEQEGVSGLSFFKTISQRVQHELVRKISSEFLSINVLATREFIEAIIKLKNAMNAAIYSIIPENRFFCDILRNCQECFRECITNAVVPRLCHGSAPHINQLFDNPEDACNSHIYLLFLIADPNLRQLKEALETYIKQNIRDLVKAGNSLDFKPIVTFYSKINRLLDVYMQNPAIQMSINKCIEWMFDENSTLNIDPENIQLCYLYFLQDLIITRKLEMQDDVFLWFLPFLQPRFFDEYFSKFFVKWILTNNNTYSLKVEEQLSKYMCEKLGEDLCKPFMSIFIDINEFQANSDSFNDFLKNNSITNTLDLLVTHVFQGFIPPSLLEKGATLFRIAENLYTTFLTSKKQHNNKNIYFDYELGSCEAVLELSNREFVILGTPIEMMVINYVVEAKAASTKDIISEFSSSENHKNEKLFNILSCILKKLCRIGIFTHVDSSYQLSIPQYTERPLTVFAYQEDYHLLRNCRSNISLTDVSHKISAIVTFIVKNHKSITFDDLFAALKEKISLVTHKDLKETLSLLTDNSIITRAKTCANVFNYGG